MHIQQATCTYIILVFLKGFISNTNEKGQQHKQTNKTTVNGEKTCYAANQTSTITLAFYLMGKLHCTCTFSKHVDLHVHSS